MNNLNRSNYSLFPLIIILLIGAGVLGYLWNKKEANPNPSASPTASASPLNYSTPTPTPSVETGNNITYTTFSSPKADFTFEYPSTWVYDEKPDPYDAKATDWGFYVSPDDKNGIPILAVVSPMTEWVDFCSGGRRSIPNTLAKLNIYKTNDPKTYVTYEECGYIYWQIGTKFSNADDIKDIHQINLIKFYFTSDFPEGNGIAQHIAESIKIK